MAPGPGSLRPAVSNFRNATPIVDSNGPLPGPRNTALPGVVGLSMNSGLGRRRVNASESEHEVLRDQARFCLLKTQLFTTTDGDKKQQDAFLKKVLRKFDVHVYEAGETIIREDAEADQMYVLNRGKVAVLSGVQETLVAVLEGQGVFFGEMGVLGVKKRSATVRASTSCHMFAFYIDLVMEALAEFPEQMVVFEEMAKKRLQKIIMERLLHLPMFIGCEEKFTSMLGQSVKVQVVPAGAAIFKQGDYGREMFVIVQGTCAVIVAGSRVDTLTNGRTFGELAFVGASTKRTETIQAEDTVVVMSLGNAALEQTLESFPHERQRFEEAAVGAARTDDLRFSLQDIEDFVGFNPSFLEMLSGDLQHKMYFRGQEICRQGDIEDDDSASLYAIIRGRVQVSIDQKHVAELKDGQCFGEACILGLCMERTATVKARTIVDALVLHRPTLLKALAVFPAEAAKFARLASAKTGAAAQFVQTTPLDDLPFFADCSGRFLSRISCAMVDHFYTEGVEVIREHEEGNSMFILHKGTMQVLIGTQDVGRIAGPACFGEMALFGFTRKRNATVKALSVCICQELDGSVLIQALQEHPEELKRFEDSMVQHARNMKFQEWDLRKVPFFDGFPEDFLNYLEKHVVQRLFLSGQRMIAQGDAGSAVYILVAGEAHVMLESNKVGEMHPGALFGEMQALGMSDRRTATVQAQTACCVQVLRKDHLLDLFRQFPAAEKNFRDLADARQRWLECVGGNSHVASDGLHLGRVVEPPAPDTVKRAASRYSTKIHNLKQRIGPHTSPKKKAKGQLAVVEAARHNQQLHNVKMAFLRGNRQWSNKTEPPASGAPKSKSPISRQSLSSIRRRRSLHVTLTPQGVAPAPTPAVTPELVARRPSTAQPRPTVSEVVPANLGDMPKPMESSKMVSPMLERNVTGLGGLGKQPTRTTLRRFSQASSAIAAVSKKMLATGIEESPSESSDPFSTDSDEPDEESESKSVEGTGEVQTAAQFAAARLERWVDSLAVRHIVNPPTRLSAAELRKLHPRERRLVQLKQLKRHLRWLLDTEAPLNEIGVALRRAKDAGAKTWREIAQAEEMMHGIRTDSKFVWRAGTLVPASLQRALEVDSIHRELEDAYKPQLADAATSVEFNHEDELGPPGESVVVNDEWTWYTAVKRARPAADQEELESEEESGEEEEQEEVAVVTSKPVPPRRPLKTRTAARSAASAAALDRLCSVFHIKPPNDAAPSGRPRPKAEPLSRSRLGTALSAETASVIKEH